MWSLVDEQELLVRADALMNAGHASGDMVARELSARFAGRQPAEFAPCVDAELADYLARHPVIEANLEGGMMVAAKLWPRTHMDVGALFEAAKGLLELDGSRWLQSLHVAGFDGHQDWDLMALLRLDAFVARPRVIVIGPYPSEIRCTSTVQMIDGISEQLLAPESGLHTLVIPGYRPNLRYHYQRPGRCVELPWSEGDKVARGNELERLLAPTEAGAELSTADFTRCMRALWDPAKRVRKRAAAALPGFGRAAAQVLPELLLPGRIQGCAMQMAPEVSLKLRRQAAVLEAIAANFSAEQLHAAKWALCSPTAARIAQARARSFDDKLAKTWAARVQPTELINLNRASAQQLQQISGIGPVYSQRIVEARRRRPFTSLDELREIPGIGERVFGQAALWLYVGPPPSVSDHLRAAAMGMAAPAV